MDTTCDSFALKGAKPRKNAAVVDLMNRQHFGTGFADHNHKLQKAGIIIIAKTSLSVHFLSLYTKDED